MATAVDVMKYIRSQMSVSGEVQLQKLMYYSQAWSLAWDGTPLFPERIEAWRMGPVVPAIRYRIDPGDGTVLSDAERATVDAVIAFYGPSHGAALRDRTHREQPWREVWGDRPGDGSCNDEIPHDLMRRYYTEQSVDAQEDVPTRRSVHTPSDDNELLEIARANATRWHETLAILAQ